MHSEEVKDESTLVSMIKSALQQNSIESFRSEMTSRIKKANKKIKNICKEEYEGYIHVMNQVPDLESSLTSISDSIAKGYQKIYKYADSIRKVSQKLHIAEHKHKGLMKSRKLLVETLELFALVERIEKALNENKHNTALDIIDIAEKRPLLESVEVGQSANGKLLISEVKKILETNKGKIIEKVDKMLNNWLAKTKQDELNMGLEIIEEIKNDLQYIENDNPLAHLNQVVNTQPSRQTKHSVLFAFNPGASTLRLSKKPPVDIPVKGRGQPSTRLQQSIIAGRSLSRMFSLVGKKPDVTVHTDLDFQALDAIVGINKRLGKEKQFIAFFKETRRSTMRQLADFALDTDIKRSLIQLIGFLVAQLHITNVYESLCTPEDLEEMWHDLLIRLEQNIEEYLKNCKTPQEIVNLKFCITWLVVATYRVGFSSQNTLIDCLLKNSGIYVQRIVEKIEKSVDSAIENETYTPIKLNDVLDYEKYAEKYGFQIEDLGDEYPIYLPYTMLVVTTNEEIKAGIADVFSYLRFICTDDSYIKLVFNATDSMVMTVQQLYVKALTTEVGSQNMGQLAQMHNNICYFQKSLDYYEKFIAGIGKVDISSYQFSSLATFTQLKYGLDVTLLRNEYEESISKQIEKKLDEFLGLFEGMNWNMTEIPKGHHEYVEDMVNWLKNNLANMESLNKTLAVECYLNSIQYVAYKMLQLIAESPMIKRITQPALYQIWLDIKFIEEHMAMVTSISLGDIKTSMRGIYQTLMLLLMDDLMEFLDPSKRTEKYIAVKGIQVLKICEKLQEVKTEMPPEFHKLKKKDAKLFTTRLKELDLI